MAASTQAPPALVAMTFPRDSTSPPGPVLGDSEDCWEKRRILVRQLYCRARYLTRKKQKNKQKKVLEYLHKEGSTGRRVRRMISILSDTSHQ